MPSFRSPLYPLLLLSLTALSILPNQAQAFPVEGQAWLGAGASNIHPIAPTAAGWWGPTLQTGLVLSLSDFWQVTADLGASFHPAKTVNDEQEIGPVTIAAAALGLRYTFDVFTYIPYAGISVVVSPFGPPSERAGDGELFSARATLGIDYRINRRVSLGGAVEVSTPLTDPASFPLYSTLRAHIGFHFRRF